MAATLATDADVRNVAAFYAAKSARTASPPTRPPWRRARRSGAAASPSARCRPAPAATARRVPACPRSTRAGRPARLLHRGAAARLPRRHAQEQRPDGGRDRRHDRGGHQGRGRLRRRPALKRAARVNEGRPRAGLFLAPVTPGGAASYVLRHPSKPRHALCPTHRRRPHRKPASPRGGRRGVPRRRSSRRAGLRGQRRGDARGFQPARRRLRARDRGRDRHADRQNVINITDLPEQAQAKLFARKSFRERVSKSSLRLFEPTDFGDVI